MEKSQEARVEDLSKKIEGRFKLTTLIQKQMRDYILGGRAFMPDVANIDELFDYILDEVEAGRLELVEPEKQPELEVEQ